MRNMFISVAALLLATARLNAEIMRQRLAPYGMDGLDGFRSNAGGWN